MKESICAIIVSRAHITHRAPRSKINPRDGRKMPLLPWPVVFIPVIGDPPQMHGDVVLMLRACMGCERGGLIGVVLWPNHAQV